MSRPEKESDAKASKSPTQSRLQSLFSRNSPPQKEKSPQITNQSLTLTSKTDVAQFLNDKGSFSQLVTTQGGSRFLQNVYQSLDRKTINLILMEILPNLSELMINNYANYFCQKFFGVLNNSQKIMFLENLAKDVTKIANNEIGTYSIQSLIGQLSSEKEKEIIRNAVKFEVKNIIFNENGVHVIEKIITVFEEEKLKEIYDIIIHNFLSLSTSANGMFVCKKMLHKCKKSIERLKKNFIELFSFLVHNQYGNYTLQIVIDIWDVENLREIFGVIFSNFISLSCEKFSSFVVEKYVEKTKKFEPLNFANIIDTITQKTNVLNLMKNLSGNFVLLKIMKLSSKSEKIKIFNCLKKNIHKFNGSKFFDKWTVIFDITNKILTLKDGEKLNYLLDNNEIMRIMESYDAAKANNDLFGAQSAGNFLSNNNNFVTNNSNLLQNNISSGNCIVFNNPNSNVGLLSMVQNQSVFSNNNNLFMYNFRSPNYMNVPFNNNCNNNYVQNLLNNCNNSNVYENYFK